MNTDLDGSEVMILINDKNAQAAKKILKMQNCRKMGKCCRKWRQIF